MNFKLLTSGGWHLLGKEKTMEKTLCFVNFGFLFGYFILRCRLLFYYFFSFLD
uniref:Uncharacterized protein n=1 Tax=Rhizophora mucronata TaxID=61149 RepID=A0A2P2NU95_RHIMU